MGTDPRVYRRGVKFTPRKSHVDEARYRVRKGMPIDERWLPFLTPSLRMVAVVTKRMELV